jgi:molybdate transport system substrate-binding protein
MRSCNVGLPSAISHAPSAAERQATPVKDKMRASDVATIVLGVMSVLSPRVAGAAELTVLAGMGVVSGVRDVASAFELATGHKVIVSFQAGPSLMQKVTSNAPADLVTHYPEAIDDLIKEGKVVGRRVDFARAGVGVAVKAGAPKPDISTPEAFKHAMLVAKSIAYSRTGASGIIAAKLMERLGLSDQLKDKTKLVDGVPIAEVVARGEAEVGMQQINVILPVAGADYVGPLPGELQGYVDFAVGVLAASKERDAAQELVKFMSSPEAAPLIRKSGMDCRTTEESDEVAPLHVWMARTTSLTSEFHSGQANLPCFSTLSCISDKTKPKLSMISKDDEHRVVG